MEHSLTQWIISTISSTINMAKGSIVTVPGECSTSYRTFSSLGSFNGGKHVKIYREYVPVHFKEYGWVIWDKYRLAKIGARELVAGQRNAASDLVEQIT